MKRAPVILGSADGLTLVLGFICGLSADPHALVHAAICGGLAELAGMTAAVWLSDHEGGFLAGLACGVATLAACVLPAVPYLLTRGVAALIPSLLLVLAVGGVVAWLRPDKGWLAITETFGVLAAAAVLCYGASLI